jgi:hypothetical protein
MLDGKFKNLENVYHQIKKGYSETSLLGKKVFIKHATAEDSALIAKEKEKFDKKSKKLGVMSEFELLDFLQKNGSWSKEEEAFLGKTEKEILGLKKTRDKMILKKHKDAIDDKIKKLEKDAKSNRKKRDSLVRNTSEEYSEKKSNEFFIRNSLFKDEDLKEPFFTLSEFEELEIEEISEIYVNYNKSLEGFSNENIRQISIEHFFFSIFSLFGEDVSGFFSKSHFNLSFYQINLLSFAKMFRHIFKEEQIPEDIRDNAEKIMDHLKSEREGQKKLKETKEKLEKSSGFGFLGASREELVEAGIDVGGAEDIHSIASKKGGALNMEDFIEIHKK